MTVDQQFTALTEKLQNLLRLYRQLWLENEKLQQQLTEAKGREAAALGRVDELQQQMAILKLAAGQMSDKDRKTFEKRISKYIKEIDKTIAYLSQ